MKYAAYIHIVDDQGEIVHERDLSADEMIEELLKKPDEEESSEPSVLPSVVDNVLRTMPKNTRGGQSKRKGRSQAADVRKVRRRRA